MCVVYTYSETLIIKAVTCYLGNLNKPYNKYKYSIRVEPLNQMLLQCLLCRAARKQLIERFILFETKQKKQTT